MKVKERITQKANDKFGKYAWYASFKEDYSLQALVIMLGGTLVNVVYAVMNGVSGIKYQFLWYGVFAGYYLVLAAQRLGVIFAYRAAKKKSACDGEKLEREKKKIYLANGAILVPLDIALAAVVTVMFFRKKPVSSGEIMAIASAAYTTYKVVAAIRNLVKAKARQDFLIQTIRNIGIVAALASLIVLQTTLVNTFSAEGEVEEMRPLMAVSSFIVCAFTIGIGVYMIIKGHKALRSDKQEKQNG